MRVVGVELSGDGEGWMAEGSSVSCGYGEGWMAEGSSVSCRRREWRSV